MRRINALPTPPESPNPLNWPLPHEGVAPTCVRTNKVTSPMVAMPSAAGVKVQEVPHQWMRPFKVDWMLCAIRKAPNDNAARAALAMWIHCDKAAELTDELLTELRLEGEPAQERLYELHKPPHIIH